MSCAADRLRGAVVALLAVAGLAALALPRPAAAQLPGGHPGGEAAEVPDVPGGEASVRGVVKHRTRPQAVGGIPIVLYALASDGVPGLRSTQSDASGAFSFDAVSNDPSTVYLVGARLNDIPFGSRFTFEAGETSRELELLVSDPADSVESVERGQARIRIQQGCSDLQVNESHELRNGTNDVIFIPPALRAERAPLLRTVLPPAASRLELPPGTLAEGIERDGSTLSYWGPLYPGSHSFEFSYGVPIGAPFVRVFATDTRRLDVYTREGARPTNAAGTPLQPGPSVDVDGVRFASLGADALTAGSRIELALDASAAASAPVPEGLRLGEVQIWLELDDAALVVSEQHEFAADSVLTSAGAPLLCLAVPENAEDLRFSNETLALGLSADGSGSIAVRGPMPAGSSSFAMRYRVPVSQAPVAFDRRFALALPLLSIFVADTGVLAESDRLHRRRPIRSADRSYVHLEAFELEPEETVALRLSPIPASRSLSGLSAAGFVTLAAAAALAFLVMPLRGRADRESAPDPVLTRAGEERASVYASIRDLEDDFETGKVMEDEYQTLRGELRARAVELLRIERDTKTAAEQQPTAEPVTLVCPKCDTAAAEDANFCAQCGSPLTSPGAAG